MNDDKLRNDKVDVLICFNPGAPGSSFYVSPGYAFCASMGYLKNGGLNCYVENIKYNLFVLSRKYEITNFEISTSWGDETKIVLSFDEVEDCVNKIYKEYFGDKQ